MLIPEPIALPPATTLPMPASRPEKFSTLEDLPVVRELPDPFVFLDEKRIAARGDWRRRREEIKELLLAYEYGHLPPARTNLKASEVSSVEVFGGKARRVHLVLSCGPLATLSFGLDLLVPQGKAGPFSVILTGDPGDTPIPEEVVGRGFMLTQFDRT